MTDFADIPATHPIPLPAPPSEPLEDAPTGPTKRGRVRWYHVAVLGLAVLLCAAAVGFSVMQSSERDDATHDRHVAQAELTDQRATTARAATRLATERRVSKAALADVAQLTTSLHQFTDLMAQEVGEVHAAYSLAVSNPDAVAEYNAHIDRANNLVDQLRAKGDEIQRQADALRNDSKAQTASISSAS